MDWKSIFKNVVLNNKDYDLSFFKPITQQELNIIKQNVGVEISGALLVLLKQTNGIVNKRFGNFVVFNSDEIVERHKLHLDLLKEAEITPPHQFLFFADNGCGECFGFIIREGRIISNQVGVYYLIDNEFRIVAPDLITWAIEWYTGELAT